MNKETIAKLGEINACSVSILSLLYMIQTVAETEGYWPALDVADSITEIVPDATNIINGFLNELLIKELGKGGNLQ